MGSLTTRSSFGRKLCYNYPKPNEGSVLVPDALNEDLFFNLDRATLLMRRQVLDVVTYHQVSPEQWEILQLIDNLEGVRQQTLCNLTLKDKGNVSRILARMLRSGWIHRAPRKNGRGFVVSLTSEGRQIKQRLPDLVGRQINRLLDPLSKDEQTELLYALKKLRILLGDSDVV